MAVCLLLVHCHAKLYPQHLAVHFSSAASRSVDSFTAGLDVEFMLHLLLDIHSRSSNKRRWKQITPAVSDSENPVHEDVSGEYAATLQHALGAVSTEPTFPLQNLDPEVWQKWQDTLPEELQIEELVKSATEPRVAALGVDMLAKGGEGLRDSCEDCEGQLPRAAAVREALSLFKVCFVLPAMK